MKAWTQDSYTKKARNQNLLARSFFKLEEIQKKEKIFKHARLVLDLGAAPGSWSQFAVRTAPNAKVIALDRSPLDFSHPQVSFLHQPIEEVDFSIFEDFDLILSDMAPKTTGIHDLDVENSLELARMALEVADKKLKKGGHFVAKVFMGSSFEEYNKALKSRFSLVRRIRPDSTRKQSREIFFVGKEKR